jgi:transcriptional regulator GlxA family with amidase domain
MLHPVGIVPATPLDWSAQVSTPASPNPANEPRTRRVGVLAFDEVEVLDLSGPFEVFSVAARVARRTSGGPPPFEVVTISRDGGPVRARGGLVLLPAHGLAGTPRLDLIIVPGGVVAAVERDPMITGWLRDRAREAELVASVCTGAFVLAAAGLLEGCEVTTHWEDLAELAAAYPGLTVVPGQRWIDGGRVVTSAGISAGIDMALHLVARLEGRDLAETTARQMEYDWREPRPGP